MCVDKLSTRAIALSSVDFDTASALASIRSPSSAAHSAIRVAQPASHVRMRSSTVARILVSKISSRTAAAASSAARLASALASSHTLSIFTSMCACKALTPSSAAPVSLRDRSSTSRTTDETAFILPSTSCDHFSRDSSAAFFAASWTAAFKETSASRTPACTVSVASHKSAFARSRPPKRPECPCTVKSNDERSSRSRCRSVLRLNISWSAPAR
mmetsp:Transcript_95361/g.267079  ORF Transcript_95361/g.267079 Transcript_95361/m.267079 type:complete len:215 (+) Transcript_95361:744-1388(+)